MIERPGATFALSLLMVCIAAIILYRDDSPPGEPSPAAASKAEVVEAPKRSEPRAAVAEESRPGPASEGRPPVPTFGVAWPGGRDPGPAATGRAVWGSESGMPEAVGSTVAARSRSRTSATAERAAVTVTSSRRPVAVEEAPRTLPLPTGAVARVPAGPFTAVQAGETLDQVALRVYGSTTAVRTLWLANRDSLDDPARPLQPGIVLRTPVPTR